MQHTFTTRQPILLYVELGDGSLSTTASDTSETVVEVTGSQAENVGVEQDGTRISVIAPRNRLGSPGSDGPIDVTVTLPAGSDLVAKVGSADVSAPGDYGTCQIKSGSGDVRLGSARGHVAVDTGSGDITLETVRQDLRVKSGSGDIWVGTAAGSVAISTGSGDVQIATTRSPAVVKTGSGDLSVEQAESDLSLSTASGDLVVGTLHRGSLVANNVSGSVRVGIPAGVPVWTDVSSLSGRIGSDLVGAGQPQDGQDHIEVRATSVTGDILLRQLRGREPA